MGVQFAAAKAVSAMLTWGLRTVFHRPAANTPGKIALYVDPHLIEHLRDRISEGSIVVVGTNGKTTVTNMIADVLECAGKEVVCNRTGANLDSGVSTVMLQKKHAQWGVFESDELWLVKILPQLKAKYVLLLNLFRDQLDRCGEIDRIQDSIVDALAQSPETVLVYNADDPLCATIAVRAADVPARAQTPSIAFGVKESMGLAQNVVADATMCQRCSSMFTYKFRQYGQLGDYCCPTCGFKRPSLDFEAEYVNLGSAGLSFDIADVSQVGAHAAASAPTFPPLHIQAPFTGAYMVYNLMAVGVASNLLGCSEQALHTALAAFNPKNGRLQSYNIKGHAVLLNLAKNPTGFNQNLKIVAQDTDPKAVAFFINDKEADGRDISWIWDIDFEELVAQKNCVVYAGGIRKNDLQVRLKYAGVQASLIDSVEEVFADLVNHPELPAGAGVYAIANYTSLPAVHAALDALAAKEGEGKGNEGTGVPAPAPTPAPTTATTPETAHAAPASAAAAPETALETETDEQPLVIAHMYPDLLNLYGDGGNVRILEQRCHWRDISVQVNRIHYGETVNLEETDLVFLGGGPDREQKLASEEILALRDDLARYIEGDGALLAICGGFQILGHTWLLGEEEVPGLGLINLETKRPGTSADRLIDNIVLDTPLATHPMVGYENHAGRTYLGEGVEPLGRVISSVGHGNNDTDKADGVRYRNVVGTYSHGPLLSKNPEIADFLLQKALDHQAKRLGVAPQTLAPLPDKEEYAANEYMVKRLGIR